MTDAERPRLDILLCAPRGFCAGVVRAIDAVERALALYGAPVYVRHEIVHNRYVVESLKRKGAVFVESSTRSPNSAPVIFSAHGVPKSVPAEAAARKLFAIDATCPLVTKVHREAEIHSQARPRDHPHRPCRPSRGDRHHGPVAARRGRAGRDRSRRSRRSAPTIPKARLCHADHAFGRRHRRRSSPRSSAASREIAGPHKEDICYATTNRQEAVKRVAPRRRRADRGRLAQFLEFAAACARWR